MAVGVQKAWSVTASSNGNSDTNANWAEGMLAPSINNSARANMAAIKGWSNQISGGCTCAGSSNAYTITSDAAAAISSAYGAGMMFMLKANHTNTGAATLNVDSVGAVAIKTSDGGDVVAGDIVSGGLYLLAYNATGPRFDLIGTFAGGSFQPLDATLTAVAGLSFSSTNAFFRATDVDTFVAESASSFRTGLGLGTAALATIGTSGDTVPKNNTANTWSAAQTQANNVGWSIAETGGTVRAALKMDTSNNIEIGNVNNASEYLGASHAFSGAVSNFTIGGIVAATISDTQTFSNKTLSSPTLSGTVAGSVTFSGTINLSQAGDNVMRIATTGGAQSAALELSADTSAKLWSIVAVGSGLGSDSLIFRDGGWAAGSTRLTIDTSGGVQARVAASSETSGTLTAASANKQIDAAGGITIPASVFTAGDIITIYAGSSSRTITQGGGGTQRLHGSATTGNLTLAARGIAGIRFISSTEWVVTGDVS